MSELNLIYEIKMMKKLIVTFGLLFTVFSCGVLLLENKNEVNIRDSSLSKIDNIKSDINITPLKYEVYTVLNSDNQFIDSYTFKNGEALILVSVLIKNNTNEAKSMSSKINKLKLISSNGIIYNAGDFPFEANMLIGDLMERNELERTGTLNSSDILPGQERKYGVTFRVLHKEGNTYKLIK